MSMVGNQIVVEDKQDSDVFTSQHLIKKDTGACNLKFCVENVCYVLLQV